MIKKIRQFSCKALLALMLAAISVTAFAVKNHAPVNDDVTVSADNIYTEDKQNFIITADHPAFILKLKSNPTTGYSWFLREYDTDLMTPVKRVYEAPANDKSTKKLIGAPGYELWTFRVKPAGFVVPQQTTIRMVYARPWSGSDNSTQLVFRVTMQGK